MKKSDGSSSMCIDYRELNEKMIKNRYPLLRIDDLFDQLSEARVFFQLDLTTDFHRLRVVKNSISLMAFRTRYGLYE